MDQKEQKPLLQGIEHEAGVYHLQILRSIYGHIRSEISNTVPNIRRTEETAYIRSYGLGQPYTYTHKKTQKRTQGYTHRHTSPASDAEPTAHGLSLPYVCPDDLREVQCHVHRVLAHTPSIKAQTNFAHTHTHTHTKSTKTYIKSINTHMQSIHTYT